MTWLLDILTRADARLTVPLAVLFVSSLTRYRRVIPGSAYRWGSAAGLTFSLAWWIVFVCAFLATAQGAGNDKIASVAASVLLPASILGFEAGAVGFTVQPKPWNIISLTYGCANALPAIVILGWMVGARLR